MTLLPVIPVLWWVGGAPGARTCGSTRIVWMRSVHSEEELRVQPFGRYGVPVRLAWLRLNHLFRSWRTGEHRPISPRLLRVLAQIQRRFGGRRIELVSG